MNKMPNLEGKKIIVTGCAGFIGSHLCDQLLASGAYVIGIDNFYNGIQKNIEINSKNPNFKFIAGDVRDTSFMIEISKNIDIIFHEAAFISVQQSLQMSELCNNVNVNGTLNILNAARINDIDRIIFASSAAIYGDGLELPKRENLYPEPLTPYGVSKLAAESYMVTFYKAYGIKTTSLRYFNVYGPRQRNTSYAGVMSLFIENIIKNNRNPEIFGDGSQTRDFVFVKDVVKANILSAISHNSAGEVFNVASGRIISINELTKLILKLTNREDLKIMYSSPRKGDILHSQADISKIKLKVNYSPDYSIEEGLKEYISHYRKMVKNN